MRLGMWSWSSASSTCFVLSEYEILLVIDKIKTVGSKFTRIHGVCDFSLLKKQLASITHLPLPRAELRVPGLQLLQLGRALEAPAALRQQRLELGLRFVWFFDTSSSSIRDFGAMAPGIRALATKHAYPASV